MLDIIEIKTDMELFLLVTLRGEWVAGTVDGADLSFQVGAKSYRRC